MILTREEIVVSIYKKPLLLNEDLIREIIKNLLCGFIYNSPAENGSKVKNIKI